MNHDPKKLEAILLDAAPPDLEIAFRPMFRGICERLNLEYRWRD